MQEYGERHNRKMSEILYEFSYSENKMHAYSYTVVRIFTV